MSPQVKSTIQVPICSLILCLIHLHHHHFDWMMQQWKRWRRKKHQLHCSPSSITFLLFFFRELASGFKQWQELGLCIGIPRVGFCQTIPIPMHTVPVVGTGTYQPTKSVVSYETHSTIDTCECMAPP